MPDEWLKNTYRGNLTWLAERTIFCTVHGSQAYGTNLPGSDTDVKGVVVPPSEYYFGHDLTFEQAEQAEPDLVIYSLKKFMVLAASCNPNIIEVLFTDPGHWISITPAGRMLVDNKRLFLSKRAKHTFSGYAMSQLKRILGHKAWLLDPPTHKPTREEFGLDPNHKVSNSALGAFKELENKGHSFNQDVMKLLGAEKEYQAALVDWNQYQTWKKNRNAKRAALEADFGYDTKHAMHLVRLMRMGEEILSTGEVHVKRQDAKELLEIRAGAWTYDQLIEYAEAQQKKLNELHENSTAVPSRPDHRALRQLCIDVTKSMLND